jgi:hypothetical protein
MKYHVDLTAHRTRIARMRQRKGRKAPKLLPTMAAVIDITRHHLTYARDAADPCTLTLNTYDRRPQWWGVVLTWARDDDGKLLRPYRLAWSIDGDTWALIPESR